MIGTYKSSIGHARSVLYSAFKETHETLEVIISPIVTKGMYNLIRNIGDADQVFIDLKNPQNLIISHLFSISILQASSFICQKGWYQYISHEKPSDEELKAQRAAICQIGKVLMALSRFIFAPTESSLIFIQWTASFVAGGACIYISKKTDPFLKRHIYPLAYYKLIQWPFKIALEIARIETTIFILLFGQRYVFGKQFLDLNVNYFGKKVNLIAATVFYPLCEEILIRGLLQNGIKVLQKFRYSYNNVKSTEMEQEIGKIFRVHLTAMIFGLLHLTNPHRNLISASIQCSLAYMGGISYGHLAEKYHTLSFSFISHSINNSVAFAASLNIIPTSTANLYLAFLMKHASELAFRDVSKTLSYYCSKK